MEPKN